MATVDVPDDIEDFLDWAMESKWGDGLPLIPPTPARVDRMLAGTDWAPDRVVAEMPVIYAPATVEKIAANAVMAGCRPEHLPVLIAAVQAMVEPEFNIYGVQATTHSCAVMVMTNGPVGQVAGINASTGVFGPGVRANATIGRAIRLVLLNVGGAYPGSTDQSSLGNPSKFSFCFAENEVESPWAPFRLELGFAESESTVTVLAAEAPHAIVDHTNSEPANLLLTFAQTIAVPGKNNAHFRDSDFFVAFGPEHAAMLARRGWTKADVREYLFQRARIPYSIWSRTGNVAVAPKKLRYLDAADDDLTIPMADRPDDIRVVVTGGPGLQSAWIPSFGVSRSVTRRIEAADGSAIDFGASRPSAPG